jgi:hypothetical protein
MHVRRYPWKNLPAWFKVLSKTAGPSEYARGITTVLKRHHKHGRIKMFAVARRLRRPRNARLCRNTSPPQVRDCLDMSGRPSSLESEGMAIPSKTLRSEKLDLRLTRKGNERNSYKISKIAAFASSKDQPIASPSVPDGLFLCRETFFGASECQARIDRNRAAVGGCTNRSNCVCRLTK